MKFERKNCPNCGSEEIVIVGVAKDNGNEFFAYHCDACDSDFSMLEIFEQKSRLQKERAEKKFLKEEIEKEEKNEKMEKDVLQKNNAVKSHLDAKQIFEVNSKFVFNIVSETEETKNVGSGVVISGKGYVLTNAHVIMDVKPDDGRILNLREEIYGFESDSKNCHELEFVYANPRLDLALLRTEKNIDEKIKLNFSKVNTGEKIFSIGNSKGEGTCILEGIVSDGARKVGNNEFFMMTIPVTSGNSGGPVFDENGAMIGLVARGRKDAVMMNYAIPMSSILEFLADAEDFEGIEIWDCPIENKTGH